MKTVHLIYSSDVIKGFSMSLIITSPVAFIREFIKGLENNMFTQVSYQVVSDFNIDCDD